MRWGPQAEGFPGSWEILPVLPKGMPGMGVAGSPRSRAVGRVSRTRGHRMHWKRRAVLGHNSWSVRGGSAGSLRAFTVPLESREIGPDRKPASREGRSRVTESLLGNTTGAQEPEDERVHETTTNSRAWEAIRPEKPHLLAPSPGPGMAHGGLPASEFQERAGGRWSHGRGIWERPAVPLGLAALGRNQKFVE